MVSITVNDFIMEAVDLLPVKISQLRWLPRPEYITIPVGSDDKASVPYPWDKPAKN